MKDLISLIIPCFNAEKFLEVAINSVKEQTYKNLEIIIIDDGSTDDTLKLVNKYVKMDPRIKVVHQENLGVSVARNKGLSICKGKYVMFLDADDNYTTPYAIETMYNKLIEEDADMCICNFTHPCFEKFRIGNKVYNLDDDVDFIKLYQDFFLIGVPWNKITKRSCLTEEFVEGIKFNEDELFNLDNLHNMKKIVFIDEVLHNYFCAPYNPSLPASAVNSIYMQEKFWEQKSTIWHMGMKNHEYRIKSINKYFPDKKEQLQYVRSFDFFFFDFLLMAKNRVEKEYIVKACLSIFKTKLFKETLKSKQKYGLKLLMINEEKIKNFVALAIYAFNDIKSNNKKLSTLRVLLGLFANFFYQKYNDDQTDLLAESAYELENFLTPESYYLKFLLEKLNNNQR